MKLYQDKDWLYQKYIVEELSTTEIGKICGISFGTIIYWLRKLSIPIRSISEANKGNIPWNKGESQTKEAKEKNRLAHLGNIPWNKGKIGIYSEESKLKMSENSKGHIPWNKGEKIQTNTGRTHFKKGLKPHNKGVKGIMSPNWRGGRGKSIKKYYIKKRKDVKFILNNRMSCLIRDCLKRGIKNRIHWEYLVDYTVKDLERRLRKKIPNGYVWEDFLNGELQIDHILPIRLFQFDSPKDKEFKDCWSLYNLRLLPAKENASKKENITSFILLGLLLERVL